MTTASAPVDERRLQRDLDTLATFTEPETEGWTRRVFQPAFVESRWFVADAMAGAGLEVSVDGAGNIIGVLAGTDPSAPRLVTGSHTDTVAGGGRFDGILGVLGAIEVVRSLRDQGHRLDHDLYVVDFLGEEPNEFGLSCVGSRAIAGTLTDQHLDLRDPSGRCLADAFADSGHDPAGILGARWADPALAFVELHIEQGPVLEAVGKEVGVVDVIAGITRFLATFRGRPDHSGTMPMHLRRDAASAAAESQLALERLASDGGGVATTGRVDLWPGSMNVVPAVARMWGEMRSPDASWLDAHRTGFAGAVQEIGERRQIDAELAWLSATSPTPCTADLQIAIEQASATLGIDTMRLPSGAGHDAVQMAHIAPTAMVFVPSKDGRSHVPEEYTSPAECARGAHVLLQTLIELDRAASAGGEAS